LETAGWVFGEVGRSEAVCSATSFLNFFGFTGDNLKKTEKTPRKEIKLALKRAEEIELGVGIAKEKKWSLRTFTPKAKEAVISAN
jgi:hypothetical protein